MRQAFPPAAVAVLVFIGAVAAIYAGAWEGTAALVALAALHVGLGLAVGRWWAVTLPVPLWFVLVFAGPCHSEDLCDASGRSFFAVIYAVCGVALVAAGIGLRRLVASRRTRPGV
jgi:hypothetical protein